MNKLIKINKTLTKMIRKNSKNCINDHIYYIKSFLYYTGKVLISTLYLKENIITREEFELINKKNSLKKLPDFFMQMKLKYEPKKYLSEEEREFIINQIQVLGKEELRKFSIGELYQSSITSKEKKELGQVYTPKYIVKQMIEEGIGEKNIINNPYFRVLDPACGGGYFLIEAYHRIKEILNNNYDIITSKSLKLKKELDGGIHNFILSNNLWGRDIDDFAVFMTKISLFLKDKSEEDLNFNILVKDVLIDDRQDLISLIEEKSKQEDIKFDLVIGNPPYIGHKKIDNEYRRFLSNIYYNVYSDKSDISYCFFQKGYELLKENGVLMFITSRYFLESPSGEGVREFICNNFQIDKIVDFYGKKVFKGIGISPVIIKCNNKLNKKDINVYKFKERQKDKLNIDNIFDKNIFEYFLINQETLSKNGWILIKEEEKNLFNKIHESGKYYLEELCNCNQGIISGYDKAFIVDKETIQEKKLESEVIKPWIKNSGVRQYGIKEIEKYIIYTDSIKNIEEYPNIYKHIVPYREKLRVRRECRKGLRKWYHLQWGRKLNIFNKPKIIFPYKASQNRFTIVYDELLCSADIYIINIKNNPTELTLEYLVAFLNSTLCEFYFKCFAKKVGEKLYDYYPNKIMNLKIKIGENTKDIEERVKKILLISKKRNKNSEIKDEEIDAYNKIIEKELKFINKYFYKTYNLKDEEISIVEN